MFFIKNHNETIYLNRASVLRSLRQSTLLLHPRHLYTGHIEYRISHGLADHHQAHYTGTISGYDSDEILFFSTVPNWSASESWHLICDYTSVGADKTKYRQNRISVVSLDCYEVHCTMLLLVTVSFVPSVAVRNTYIASSTVWIYKRIMKLSSYFLQRNRWDESNV